MSSYNGYTNWETWLVALYTGDSWTEEAKEQLYASSGDEETAALLLSDVMQDYYDEVIYEIYQIKGGILEDFLNKEFSKVNWKEIAKLIIEEIMDSIEEEEEE